MTIRRAAYIITLVFALSTKSLYSQTDSTLSIDPHTHDSSYTIHENVPKSTVWGNSTYIAFAYNRNYSHETDFNIGRAYGQSHCSGGGCVMTALSWGVGAGLLRNKDKNVRNIPVAKAFWEFALFYYPPYSAALRGEYIYDINNKTHYFRPAAGLSLMFFDVLYNYSFKVGGNGNNLLRHGVSFRFKYFYKTKNWQNNYPSKC